MNSDPLSTTGVLLVGLLIAVAQAVFFFGFQAGELHEAKRTARMIRKPVFSYLVLR